MVGCWFEETGLSSLFWIIIRALSRNMNFCQNIWISLPNEPKKCAVYLLGDEDGLLLAVLLGLQVTLFAGNVLEQVLHLIAALLNINQMKSLPVETSKFLRAAILEVQWALYGSYGWSRSPIRVQTLKISSLLGLDPMWKSVHTPSRYG